MKTTKKELKNLVATGKAIDLTYADCQKGEEIHKLEGWLEEIAYSCGIYGVTGKLLRGHKTGTLYAITDRTNAIYIF